MAQNKTVANDKSVSKFIQTIESNTKKTDALTLVDLITGITGESPTMWGASIIGFGSYHYKYDSGREGDMPLIGFSPRKKAITIYLMDGFDAHQDLLKKLGKHKTSKACLYINKLADVEMEVLCELLKKSYKQMKESNG